LIIGIAILLLSIVGAALGQTFEVASVKLSSLDANSTSGIKTGHGRLDAHNVTLKRCIMGAYAVGPHQISGGPDWLDFDRFDILAKADQPVDDDGALMAMLRTLLGERFKLAIRRETRPMTAFVLQVAKNGPKMEPPPENLWVSWGHETSSKLRQPLVDRCSVIAEPSLEDCLSSDSSEKLVGGFRFGQLAK